MEFLLVVYVISGIVKSFFLFWGIVLPVDFTLLTLIVLLLYGIVNNKFIWLIEKHILSSLFMLLFFTFWIIFSLIYSVSPGYKYSKLIYFVTNLIAFSLPLFLRSLDLSRILRSLVILTFVLSLVFLPLQYLYWIGHSLENYDAIKGQYLFIGKLVGLSLVLLLAKPKEFVLWNHIVDIILAFCLLIFLVMMGGRGPLLFFVLIYLLYFVYRRNALIIPQIVKLSRKEIVIYLLFSILICSVLFLKRDLITVLLQRTITRFSDVTSHLSNSKMNFGNSINIRLFQISTSFDFIFSSLKNFFFGSGFGSFGLIVYGTDMRAYPHNMFLEAWFEIGIIGLGLFLLFLYSIVKKIRFNYQISIFPLLYLFLNSMKSASIIDLRLFFLFMALYITRDNVSLKLLRKA